MARNKHPEETVHLILDTACRLFLKKGYEHTSIQDIIDNLGGLSKGAIYHHFKSKEDILAAVTDQMTSESNQMLAAIRDRSDLNGREKLRTIFKASINRPVQNRIFTIAPNFNKNPKLLLCDEPTGALDYQTGKAILKLLQDMCRQRGMTVIVITHNSALTPMADRVIRIKNGKVSSMKINETPLPVEEIEW